MYKLSPKINQNMLNSSKSWGYVDIVNIIGKIISLEFVKGRYVPRLKMDKDSYHKGI
jgi:hypothetical protein